MFPFPTTISDFVIWLGTPAAGGVIFSLLLERISAWRNWHSPIKSHITVAIFVSLPFVAQGANIALRSCAPEVVRAVDDVLALAMSGLLAWAASQYAHAVDPVCNKDTKPCCEK